MDENAANNEILSFLHYLFKERVKFKKRVNLSLKLFIDVKKYKNCNPKQY